MFIRDVHGLGKIFDSSGLNFGAFCGFRPYVNSECRMNDRYLNFEKKMQIINLPIYLFVNFIQTNFGLDLDLWSRILIELGFWITKSGHL